VLASDLRPAQPLRMASQPLTMVKNDA